MENRQNNRFNEDRILGNVHKGDFSEDGRMILSQLQGGSGFAKYNIDIDGVD